MKSSQANTLIVFITARITASLDNDDNFYRYCFVFPTILYFVVYRPPMLILVYLERLSTNCMEVESQST